MRRILTIAGSDSGGGSGIQADLKTILSLGGYGMSVITALTAQNTLGVQSVVPVESELVGQQMDAVLGDIGADSVKTGVLANGDIVRIVSGRLKKHNIQRLVVDPITNSTSGTRLIDDEGKEALVENLFPLTLLLTPNIPEAEEFTGLKIANVDDMKEAARRLQEMGPKYVLVKGGHLESSLVDVLHDGSQHYEYSTYRVRTRHTHGTGCTLASAIATHLADGVPMIEAIDQAKRYLYTALRFSLNLGGGIGPTNHYASITREMARSNVIEQLQNALDRLRRLQIGHLIPEVQSNLAFALPYAETVADVASFPGRLVRLGNTVGALASAKFGASTQIHRLVLGAMDYNPERRAAMTIAYSEGLVKRIAELGYSIAGFDRNRTPPDLQMEEGSTLAWGVLDVMEELGEVPDAIFDRGAVGKVPVIRLFGKDPGYIVDLVAKL